MRISLLLWSLFIVYGSFIPFRFASDPTLVRENIANIKVHLFRDGQKNFSVLDLASNTLLFVPFGFLVAASGRSLSSSGRWALRTAVVGLSATAFGIAIEAGQLFTLERISSVLDVTANTTGAIIGAGVAWLLSRLSTVRLFGSMLEQARKEPALLLLGVLVVTLAADAFYPFAITLDVSTAWHNFKNVRWLPFADPAPRFWIDLLMDKVLIYSLFAAVLRRSLQSLCRSANVLRSAWLMTVFFGIALEVGKLAFIGRVPNADNLLLAAVGALAGVTLIPMIVRSTVVRSHPLRALLIFSVVLIVHLGLTPFEFRLDSAAIAAKIARIEWLPFAAYYQTDPQKALFDLWQKLLRYGLLGFSAAGLRDRGLWVPAAVGLIAGSILEAAQLTTAARNTSVTDVLISGVGALLGGVVHARYRDRCDSA